MPTFLPLPSTVEPESLGDALGDASGDALADELGEELAEGLAAPSLLLLFLPQPDKTKTKATINISARLAVFLVFLISLILSPVAEIIYAALTLAPAERGNGLRVKPVGKNRVRGPKMRRPP